MNATQKLIDDFRQKACAWQSQNKANKLKQELKSILTEEEYWPLTVAHSHYLLGEGSAELYDICKQLMEKYNEPVEE